MIKLIAIDLDGTLLRSDKSLSDENINALKYAHNKGIKIVICTGRPYQAILPILQVLDFQTQDDYFITFNGGQVQRADNHQIILQQTLDYEDFKYWRNQLERINLPMNPVDQNWVYEPLEYQKGFESIYVSQVTSAPSKKVNFDYFNESDQFLKFVVSIDSDHLQKQKCFIEPELLKNYEVVNSHPFQLEISRKGVSKGSTLKLLGEEIGIKPDEMMTIGDQNNDQTMIEMAGIGVVMRNGSQDIIQMADYITDTNDNNGVAKAIYHWIK